MRNQVIIGRQFRLVLELSKYKTGLTSERLAERLGVSRPTVDRDLQTLRQEVRLPIQRKVLNGETRHVLDGIPLTTLTATPLQLAALKLTRELLTPLEGSAFLREIDRFLTLSPRVDRKANEEHAVSLRRDSSPHAPAILQTLEQALEEKRRVRISVRVATRGGDICSYDIDPIALRYVDASLYLFAWVPEKSADRTFKLARITAAELLRERACPPAHLTSEEAFSHAVKAWSGALTRVRIRIAPSVAWLLPEYPLVPGNTVQPQPDGSAIVDAMVSGTAEAARWTLSWGENAEALEPKELRDRVASHLQQALIAYDLTQPRSTKLSDPAPSAPGISKHSSTTSRRAPRHRSEGRS